MLTEKLTNSVYANLKKIDYKSFNGDKQSMSVKDNYSVVSLLEKEITILFTREVTLDLVTGYTLSVEVEFKRFAKEGVNLDDILKGKIVDQNIDELSAPIMSYLSLLVAQITASFNRQPIITSPNYISHNAVWRMLRILCVKERNHDR